MYLIINLLTKCLWGAFGGIFFSFWALSKRGTQKVPDFSEQHGDVFLFWTAIFLATMMLFKPEEVEGKVGVILYILQVSQNLLYN